MTLSKTTLKETPSGLIQISWDGLMARVEFNCSCLDAVELCKGMCCRWRSGYSVELEPDEVDNYINIKHPTRPDVRILASDWERKWCIYFDSNKGLCTIHDKRPRMCQRWGCSPETERDDEKIVRRDAGWMLTPIRKEEVEFNQKQMVLHQKENE